MNQLDNQYQDLLFKLIVDGRVKDTRNGKTISIFGHQIRHRMSEGFPLLTTKKMYWRGIVTELLWFLRGDTNIKYLVDNDCHIWDGDAYKNYVSKQTTENVGSMNWFIEQIKTDPEFAKKWGDLGPIYGKQWRRWKAGKESIGTFTYAPHIDIETKKPLEFDKTVDQIANLIRDLKTNPDSRRLMVSAWNVGELDQMTLPPCHYGFQVYTRELSWEERDKLAGGPIREKYPSFDKIATPTRAISLMWNQRSVDVFLGLPFNIASYGLLLEIIAKEVNMVPDELIGNLGDVHLYQEHLEQARQQITREPYALPRLIIDQFDESNHYIGDMDDVSEYNIEQFKLEGYQSHPAIKAPLIN